MHFRGTLGYAPLVYFLNQKKGTHTPSCNAHSFGGGFCNAAGLVDVCARSPDVTSALQAYIWFRRIRVIPHPRCLYVGTTVDRGRPQLMTVDDLKTADNIRSITANECIVKMCASNSNVGRDMESVLRPPNRASKTFHSDQSCDGHA